MKSCLSLLMVLLAIGAGALIWYLSDSAEFSRKDAAPPKARVVPVPGRR
jgi:hypothetical protein